jgi:3-polyprenyl-4-hydroxybenzoate decarboxylase
MKRIIIGISGATGIIHGIRLLQVLREVDGVETQRQSPAATSLRHINSSSERVIAEACS